MSAGNCCSASVQIFCDWVIPEGIIHRRLGDCYQSYPMLSRFIVTPIALIAGIVKVAFFPIICLVGVVVMPIIAVALACMGKEENNDWLTAWSFCILSVAASIAFLGVSCYYMPLLATVTCMVIFISFSIVIHVYKLVKEPPVLKNSKVV